MAIAKSCPPDELGNAAIARDLEMLSAEYGNALRLVHELVTCIERQGGYLSYEEQHTLHEGRELAIKEGLRKAKVVTPWLGK